MNDDISYSIDIEEARQWAEHERLGGKYILVMSLSIGSTRAVGPFDSLIDAMEAGALIEEAGRTNEMGGDPDWVLTTQIIPLLSDAVLP